MSRQHLSWAFVLVISILENFAHNKFFIPNLFLYSNSFGPKNFLTQNFFDQMFFLVQFFYPTFFLAWKFLLLNLFYPNYFYPHFFGPRISLDSTCISECGTASKACFVKFVWCNRSLLITHICNNLFSYSKLQNTLPFPCLVFSITDNCCCSPVAVSPKLSH